MPEQCNREPLRTCIACRHERTKDELLRFVLAPDMTVVPDIVGRLPGRGAYTCLDPECVEAAVRKRQFHRAFRGEARTVPETMAHDIGRLVMERLQGLLALINRAGMVVSGNDAVERELHAQMAGGIVWVAGDAARDRQQKFTYLGERAGCAVLIGSTTAELGAILGKEQRAFLLLKPSGITAKLRNELQRFRKFIDGGAQVP